MTTLEGMWVRCSLRIHGCLVNSNVLGSDLDINIMLIQLMCPGWMQRMLDGNLLTGTLPAAWTEMSSLRTYLWVPIEPADLWGSCASPCKLLAGWQAACIEWR